MQNHTVYTLTPPDTKREKYIFRSKEATPWQVIHTSIREHNNRPKRLEVFHNSVT